MPPKPFPKGKEAKKMEPEKEPVTNNFEEQERKLTSEDREGFSGSVERGVMKSEGQKSEKISSDYSSEAFEKESKRATDAQLYWSAELNKISNVDRTISASQAEEFLLVLRQELNDWMTQQEQYEEAMEERPELEESVTPVIAIFEETIKIMQDVQRLLEKTKEVESSHKVAVAGMKVAKSEADYWDTEKINKGSSLSPIMDKLSLDERNSPEIFLKKFAPQQLFAAKSSVFQFDDLSLSELKSTAKSLVQSAEKLRSEAKAQHDSARRAYFGNQFDQAIRHYNNAIVLAEQTAFAYTETEQVHSRLKNLGEKVRQWGMHLKKRWTRYAEEWQEELRLLIQKIKIEERNKKIEEIANKIVETKTKLATALQQRDLADQEERNEIGETWDAIARRWKVIQNHFQKAQEAYEGGDEATAKSLEPKIATLEARNAISEEVLGSLRIAMEIWKRDYSSEASRYLESREELQTDRTKKISLIYKRRFVGPLLRIERKMAANGEIFQETKMAAEYLMVKLNADQRETLLEKLREDFPNNHLMLEEVAPEQSLYRLNFKPSGSATAAAGSTDLLTLLDQIKRTIEEKNLALDCYPSTLIELASSKISETAKKRIIQPWWLHSQFGVNPPPNLFDEAASIIPGGAPIRIAVLDSGIRESHQAFKNKIVVKENEEGEISYGFNACAIHPDQKGLPRDNTGHGTHVAGIIVGLPYDVEEVEVKRKKNSEEEPTIFDLHEMERATIRGLASMPHVAEILVCKHMEPGQTEGFVDRALECVRYAREHEARIINCSWGGARDDEGELSQKNLESLKQALSNPYEILKKEEQIEWSSYNPPKFAPPVVAVMAAGNLRLEQNPEKRDKDVYPSYPASLSLPNAIAVAATREDGSLAKISYYGKKSIQIAAPGTGIISASYSGDDAYRKLAGTSMATPQVAAAIAWIMKKFNLSPQKMVEHLGMTANQKEPALAVASGRLDLAKALSEEPTSLKTKQEIEIEEAQKEFEEKKRLSSEKKMEKQKRTKNGVAPKGL